MESRTGSEPPVSPTTARVLSSSLGAVITAFVVTPLDVVKVRQQAAVAEKPLSKEVLRHGMAACTRCGLFILNCGLIHGEVALPKAKSPHFAAADACACPPLSLSTGAASHPAASARPTRLPKGTLRALGSIFQREGIAGVYAGLGPSLAMAVPATVLYFSAYDELKARLQAAAPGEARGGGGGEAQAPPWAPALAGMVARVAASAATSPFELVRTLMMNGDMGSGTLGSFRALMSEGGVPALWRGLEPTLWRDVPFSGVYWFAYEAGKRELERRRWPEDIQSTPEVTTPAGQAGQYAGAARAFVAGAGAGMVAAAVTTPFDVVKTRRQVYSSVASLGGEVVDRSAASGNGSTPQVIRAIVREEGLAGLFRGLEARVLKITPACAIMISSYEAGKRALGLLD